MVAKCPFCGKLYEEIEKKNACLSCQAEAKRNSHTNECTEKKKMIESDGFFDSKEYLSEEKKTGFFESSEYQNNK